MILNLVGLAEPYLNEFHQGAIRKAWEATVGNRDNDDAEKGFFPVPNRRKRQQQIRLSVEQINQLVADYAAGTTINELANKWGIHRTTVMDHLKRREVTTRRGSMTLDDDQIAEAVNLYRYGASLAALGRRYGVQPETVRRALVRKGQAIGPKSKR